MKHTALRIPNASDEEFRAGGRETAQGLLRRMHGAEGSRQLISSHDPYAVCRALLTAVAQMRVSGATGQAIKAWEAGFSETMDSYVAGSRAVRVSGQPRASRLDLLNSTAVAPALGLLDDRTQLALIGFDTRDLIDASARTATLEDCRELGREHGEQDARENVAALRLAEPLEKVNARQLERALRRIRNLTRAEIGEEKLTVYVDSARQAFRRTTAAVVPN